MMNNNLKKATDVSFGNDEGGIVADDNLKQVMGKVDFGMGNIYLSLVVMSVMKTHADKELGVIRDIADEMGEVLKDFKYRDKSERHPEIDVGKTKNLESAVGQVDGPDKMGAVIGIISGVFESVVYVTGLFEMNDLSARMDNLKTRITAIERVPKARSKMMLG